MVSVVMSVYNEKIGWLKQSIDSIIQQTFTDFEFIIICDNPSFVEGIRLLEDYKVKDKRIIVLYNKENIGLTKSLNKGIKAASGKYIARMDADDISLPNRLSKQVTFMENNPEIVASGTGAYIMTGNHLRLSNLSNSFKILKSLSIFDSPIYHPTAIFKRVINDNIVEYNEEFRYSQDYELWIRLMEGGFLLSNLAEPLIKYRVSDSQISTASHGKQRVFAVKNQLNAIRFLKLPFTKEDSDILRDITRTQENVQDVSKVKDFILKFSEYLYQRPDLDRNSIVDYLLLLYAVYIPDYQNLIIAFYNLTIVFLKTKRFSLKIYLSLFNKFLRKWKIR